MSPAKNMRDPPATSANPPHRARFRSSGFRAEKCCAGVSVIGSAEVFASCHQSSSSTRRIPHERTSAPFPSGVTTRGSKRSASLPSVRLIAVIVVVVTQQHRRDRRQVIELHGRLPNSTRSEHIQRTCTLGIHRVREDVSCCRLDQKGRVTDERDDRPRAIQSRRQPRRFVNPRRPRGSPLEQHPRNGREWLSGETGGIEESPAVRMVAFRERHRGVANLADSLFTGASTSARAAITRDCGHSIS